MKKTSLRRLVPQDFDADTLRELTREGRVYICMPKVEDKSAYKQEIMDYVQAFNSRNYIGQSSERTKRGKNDSIYERLDVQFTFEQAMQHSVAIKGANVTRNTVVQMLKNWRNQGLVIQSEKGMYRKLSFDR